jgi:hypothetical protein
MWETVVLGLVLVALLVFAVVAFRRRHEDHAPADAAERRARGEAEAYQASRYWQE